ncbi:MAG TPA: DUF3048 domain-containing protein [Candidatus Limnocylindria bacterium]|nr:DUF3048 domain-containing protein [Candidatus Limnocylindria bacterium]
MRWLALLSVAAIVACGGPTAAPSTAPSGAPAASAAAPAKAIWPLRGTDAPSADATKRRPIVVRVPNDPSARPQSGLADADIVFEMLVEGGITRYAVVFHSRDAQAVGPIRSARLSDLHYLPMLRGILAHVGASGPVLDRIRQAAGSGQFVDLDQFQHGDAYDRVSSRPAPQNVYTSTQRLRDAAKDTAKVDVPALEFDAQTQPGGKPVSGIQLRYAGAQAVSYRLENGAYARIQDGKPTPDDAAKKDVAVDNVVIIKTDITEVKSIVEDELGSFSLDIRSTGTGPVVILRDGLRYEGTWSREGTDMYRFKDSSGKPLKLKPGLTWIHVVPLDFDTGT